MPSFSAILSVFSILIMAGTSRHLNRHHSGGYDHSIFLSRQQLKSINDLHQANCPYQESSGKFCATNEYEIEVANFKGKNRDVSSLDISMNLQMNDEASKNATELKYCCFSRKESCFSRCAKKANSYVVDGFPDNYPLLILLDKMVVLGNLSQRINRTVKWDHAELKCSLEERNLTTTEEETLAEEIERNILYFNGVAEIVFKTTNPFVLHDIFMDYQAYMNEANYLNFPSSIEKLHNLNIGIFKGISKTTFNQLKDGTAPCEDSHFWQLEVGLNSRKIFGALRDDSIKERIGFDFRDRNMS